MVLVGLGSNQGDSMRLVPAAMQALERFAMPQSMIRSRLWKTSPVDCPPESSVFVNAAVSFEAVSALTPEILLGELKALEQEFGRGAKWARNAPRELDLDLLVFDQHTRASDWFTLPHPRATERLFVLAPAAEVAPDLIWPDTGKTVLELLNILDTDEQALPVTD